MDLSSYNLEEICAPFRFTDESVSEVFANASGQLAAVLSMDSMGILRKEAIRFSGLQPAVFEQFEGPLNLRPSGEGKGLRYNKLIVLRFADLVNRIIHKHQL